MAASPNHFTILFLAKILHTKVLQSISYPLVNLGAPGGYLGLKFTNLEI